MSSEDHLTVPELRARGWTIPDGFTFGDLDAHLHRAPRRINDVCRFELRGRRLGDLRYDEHWTRGDAWAEARRADVEDDRALREHFAAIGVLMPTDMTCCG